MMNSLELDLDTQMSHLESEWRHVYEDSINARAEYQRLAADPNARAATLDVALEKLDKAEERKGRIMAKIERLEERLVGRD